MDHMLSAKIAKFTSLENLYEYGIINCDFYHITFCSCTMCYIYYIHVSTRKAFDKFVQIIFVIGNVQ